MSYKESKMTLNKIRDDYACKGEVLFRSALQYVVECGYRLLEDSSWVKIQLQHIDEKHNEAEKEGKMLFIGREFEKAIIKCAAEIAKVPTMDLLQYVQKEVWLSGEGIDYQRAIELLKSCLEWFLDSNYYGEDAETLKRLRMLDLTDHEIEEFGYGWLFEEEEE